MRSLLAASVVVALGCGSSGTSDPLGGMGSSSGASSSGGASSSSSGSSGAGSSSAAQACVDGINADRATLGLPAYTRWESNESCVDGQAQADSTGGPHSAFTKCGEMAQNECPGWPGPPAQMISGCLKAMWAEGPGGGHYDNMANKGYTKVACGFFTASDGSVWATQDFQ
jgi:hypothetical protein